MPSKRKNKVRGVRKVKEGGGEKAKSKSQDCCVTLNSVKLYLGINILTSNIALKQPHRTTEMTTNHRKMG